MDRASRFGGFCFLWAPSLLLSAPLAAGPIPQEQQPAPDNSKTNQGDGSKGAATAGQQKMNPAGRNITGQIRASIFKDQSLSAYAHNIKIITRDGKVTRKGPVRTNEEKANIEARAAAVAGAANVSSQMEGAPAKHWQ